jgi:hypothetical protein
MKQTHGGDEKGLECSNIKYAKGMSQGTVKGRTIDNGGCEEQSVSAC